VSSAIPLGALGFAALAAGWSVAGSLAITPLVVPALLAFRGVTGLLARAEASLANELLGTKLPPPRISSGGAGFWRRGGAVLADGTFWRQQVYLFARSTLGLGLATVELSLLGGGLWALTEPITYRWNDADFGSWKLDRLSHALAIAPAGVLMIGAGLLLVRPLGVVFRALASALLSGPAGPERRAAVARAERRLLLLGHACFYGALNLLLMVIWAGTTGGYFWPEWTLLPLGAILALHAFAVLSAERPGLWRRRGLSRPLAIHAAAALDLFLFLTLVWAVTSRASFWPMWVAVGLAFPLLTHALVVLLSGGMAERIETLETSRAGAVSQQESELRRIERDLHDGAQARLVSLGMSLGMAEQKLEADPEAARTLVAEARAGVGEALTELRNLVRGIHPPILGDRGLGAAIGALADASPMPVRVTVDVRERPPAPVETAAYFVVAEALANAAKHAGARSVDVNARRANGVLTVEVTDDGAGGADPAGQGLAGLRRRVEALDGTLSVTSPAGGPTIVRAVLPCAS